MHIVDLSLLIFVHFFRSTLAHVLVVGLVCPLQKATPDALCTMYDPEFWRFGHVLRTRGLQGNQRHCYYRVSFGVHWLLLYRSSVPWTDMAFVKPGMSISDGCMDRKAYLVR